MPSIRKAKIDDAEQIAQISVSTWNNTYQGLIPSEILKARRVDDKRILDWKKKITDNNFITLVYDDGKIQGYLWAGPRRDNIGIKYEIYAIYVRTNRQKNGIGQALLREYQEIINYEPFYLYMIKSNPAASFYQKAGGIAYPSLNKTIDVNNYKIDEEIFIFNKKMPL